MAAEGETDQWAARRAQQWRACASVAAAGALVLLVFILVFASPTLMSCLAVWTPSSAEDQTKVTLARLAGGTGRWGKALQQGRSVIAAGAELATRKGDPATEPRKGRHGPVTESENRSPGNELRMSQSALLTWPASGTHLAFDLTPRTSHADLSC